MINLIKKYNRYDCIAIHCKRQTINTFVLTINESMLSIVFCYFHFKQKKDFSLISIIFLVIFSKVFRYFQTKY